MSLTIMNYKATFPAGLNNRRLPNRNHTRAADADTMEQQKSLLPWWRPSTALECYRDDAHGAGQPALSAEFTNGKLRLSAR